MSTTLSRAVRSARLSVLALLARQLDDIEGARHAADAAIASLRAADQDVTSGLMEAAWLAAAQPGPPPPADPDDPQPVLELLAACCHPSLPEAARIALMLGVGAGLSTEEISRAFAVSTETMGRRMAWSAHRVRPLLAEPVREATGTLPLERILDVLALVFDDGIVHPHCRVDLPEEAVETTRALIELLPAEQEPRALLALMLLTRARRDARQSDDGSLVPLEAQDRSVWHRSEIEEGLFLLRGSKRAGRNGPYQLRASIQAIHVSAANAEDTDRDQLLALHDQLMQVAPSDAVALGRAAALASVHGPEAGLETVERLDLDSHLYHATRSHLLRLLGRHEDAEHAWTAAVARVRGAMEHAELRRATGH